MAQKLHHPGHTHTHRELDFPTRRDFLSSLISAAVLVPWVFGQNQTPADTAERFRQMSEEAEGGRPRSTVQGNHYRWEGHSWLI